MKPIDGRDKKALLEPSKPNDEPPLPVYAEYELKTWRNAATGDVVRVLRIKRAKVRDK
jgi:hypothetical protein